VGGFVSILTLTQYGYPIFLPLMANPLTAVAIPITTKTVQTHTKLIRYKIKIPTKTINEKTIILKIKILFNI